MFHTPRFARLFGLSFALVLLVAWLSSVRAATEPAAPVQVDGAPPSVQTTSVRMSAPERKSIDLSPAAFDLVKDDKPIKPAGKPLTPPADRPAPRPALTPPAAAAGILAPSAVSQSQIVNGDFELGDTGWYRNSKNGNPIIIHDGSSWVARLGGSNNEEAWFAQSVTVSADRPLLQFSYRGVSEEVGCNYDKVNVWVSGAILRTFDICEAQYLGGWNVYTIPLDNYAGQNIWLEFNVITDGSYISSFYFDYIGLRAYGDCVELASTHEGQGGDPVATPASMIGCWPGWYRYGTTVTVNASPASGWHVARWSGTNNDSSTSTTNTITFDDFYWSHTVKVYYEQSCYTLSRNHSGNGGDPTTNPANSTGCANGQYTAGQSITVYASPASGYRVKSWSGTTNDSSTATSNTVSMPASNHTVGVTYEVIPPTCYTLTRTHTGQGNDPTASPANSTGCSAGQYTAGQSITVYASPAAGWYVTGWSGTNNNAGTATSNTVTMPAYNHTVGVTYGQSCYTLSRNHSGNGGDPTTNPANSTGCSAGQYTAGQSITVYASPAAGWYVTGWSGTNNNAGTATSNTVTMPAYNHTVGVTYGQSCYTLSRNHSGNGGDPTTNPANSTGCANGQYTAGQSITVYASPAAGYRVKSWSGTTNDSSTATSNTVSMPGNNHTVGVTYEVIPPTCYTLSLTHSGQGGDPTTNPTNSTGCSAGQYTAGQSITVYASPAAGYRVTGWTGTTNNAGTTTTNTVTMPASNHTVGVTYEVIPPTCYALTRNHTGNGDDPTANPTNSAGCPANQYTAGQSIVVSASPDAGWVVSGWTGTNNDSSTSNSNVVSMPAGPHTVTVKYAQPACYPLTLSHEGQGGDPVASPANSSGCANGKYHEGTAISLSATPAGGWEMIGWQGSIDDNSHDTSNFAFMPAGPHEVVARYGRSTVLGELLFLPSVVSIPSTAPGCYQGEMEKYPNNTRSQAAANGPFCFGKTYRGLPEDNLDTFLYQLTTSGRISALVTNLRWGAGQAALVLSDQNGSPLKRDEAAADRLAFISDTLPPGNYFITIILDKPNATETTQYSLLVEVE